MKAFSFSARRMVNWRPLSAATIGLFAGFLCTPAMAADEPVSRPEPVITPLDVKAVTAVRGDALVNPDLAFTDAPTDLELSTARVFVEPLIPTQGDLVAEENQALAKALVAFKAGKKATAIKPLVQFIRKYPDSRWRAALELNLGLLRYQTGYFSEALAYFESAWNRSKNETSDEAMAMAGRAYSELVFLNAKVGRFDEMKSRFDEAADRDFKGSSAMQVRGAHEGFAMMTEHPERAFKCGPFAVNSILNIGKTAKGRKKEIEDMPSTQAGTSLAQVKALSERVGLNYQMAKRSPGAAFVVPSVVHWKIGHFAAIVEKKDDTYLIQDPTFGGGELWVTEDALEAESSGYFLIPSGSKPWGWTTVPAAEAATVWGKGGANTRNECKAPGSGTEGCPGKPGMVSSSVYKMEATLRLDDLPIFYRPPVGPAMDFAIGYNHMEVNQPANFTFTNLTPNWTFNWLSYLTIDASQNVTVVARGGGSEVYNYSVLDNVNGVYAPHLTSQAVIAIVSGRYERRLPDGSKEIFNQPDGTGRFFMTQVVDPQGNAVQVNYDSNFRITTILDALNQQTTITYKSNTLGDAGFYKIARITDPFGRFASFDYNTTYTQLLKITDVVGITSQFTYDVGSFVSSLVTPYGKTLFYQYTAGDGTARGLRTTFPDGTQQAMENWIGHSLNSYFWDRKAMAHYPDTAKARVTHYLLEVGANMLSPVPQSIKLPLENPVTFDYPSQPAAVPATGEGDAPGEMHYYTGVSNRPSTIDRVLDDGVTHQTTQTLYNDFGRVTRTVDPLGRTVNYLYSANNLDLLEVRGPSNDLLGKWTYNSRHRPLTAIDGSGQKTVYTYNTRGQMLTVTDPLSHVTTFTYDTNGYLTQVDGPLYGANDITTVTYDGFGRVRTVKNSENYLLTYDYDALNRLTKVTYPDGTYEQATWDRLDPVLMRDRLGRWTQRAYSALSQVLAEIDPEGRTTRYTWCSCGSMNSLTDPAGRKTEWSMDLQGRPTQKIFADGKTIDYVYENTTSRLKTVTDSLAQVTTYTYNVDDSLDNAVYTNTVNATSTVSYTYDSAYPRLATAQNGWGTLTYAYNPYITDPLATPVTGGGRLQSVTNNVWADSAITYAYDETGRKLTQAINGSANTTAWAYDDMGRVTGVTNPLGSFTYAYVAPSYGTARLDNVTYPNGQVTSYTWQGNSGDQWLQQIHNLTTGSATLSTFDYAYNAAGQITQWTQQADSATPTRYDFGYDNADQLKSAVRSNATTSSVLEQQYYTYSSGGNRTGWQVDGAAQQATYNSVNQLTGTTGGGAVRFQGTITEPGTVTVNGTPASMPTSTTFTANPVLGTGSNLVAVAATDGSGNTTANNYEVSVSALGATTSPVYDAAGNLTDDGNGKTYEWDAGNRLLAINNGTLRSEFTYDPLGRRVQIVEKDGGMVLSTKHQLWDGAQVSEERDGSNTVTKRFYVQGVQVPGATSPDDKLFYTRDHLGSVRELTDSAGVLRARYDYDPYGRTTKVSGDLNADFGYTGHYYHATSGLYLTFFRAYDPNTARWLSRDPIGEAGGINLYGYVENNPVNDIDPLGLSGGRTPGSLAGTGRGPNPWSHPTAPGNTNSNYSPGPEGHWNRNQNNKCPKKEPKGGKCSKGDEWSKDEGNPFHGGLATYRTKEGSQCAYDSNGDLVNSGPYQGTFDHTSPQGPLSTLWHGVVDVLPSLIWGNNYTPTPPGNTY
ncbi:MAG TPA: RHS repeat-associated core domain-containing protein [Roseimicrobium sp.]|nr:RHS repeat-associated core domain-containing protein [Roseimicrobium sp.]